jgi:hypothetical protein
MSRTGVALEAGPSSGWRFGSSFIVTKKKRSERTRRFRQDTAV